MQADRILRENDMDILGPLRREHVGQAYHLLFHSHLEDEDLDKLFTLLDARDMDTIEGLDFFVALLNEKEVRLLKYMNGGKW